MAYTIPAARTYDWGSSCGIPGGIPSRTTIYASMTSANTAAQINSAISACPSGQVVYLAAGTYNFGSTRMTVKSGVTVRGAGAGQTIINHSGYQILRYDGSAFSDSTYNSVSSGYEAGSTAVVLSSTPHAYFVAGSFIAITEEQSPNKFDTGIGDYARDGLSDGAPSLSGSRCFRYISRIESVSGNTINLVAPIPVSFTPSLNIRAHPMNISGILSQFGIEDMTFDGCSDPVLYYTSDRCWFYSVEFDNCAGCDQGHIIFHNGFQNEVRRCYIHDAPGWPTVTEAMGIGIGYGTCNGLFVDNITRRTSSSFIVYGSAANAIVYNYCMDCTRANDPPGVVMPMIFYHGPQGLMNLVEGNIGPGYCPDGYHGSASHDTILRNHLNGLCTGRYADRRVMNLNRGSYYINAVGNVLGDSSWSPTAYEGSGTFAHTDSFPWVLGYPNSGNSSMTPETTWSTYPSTYPDAAVESTLIRHGNYDYYTDSQYEWADADHDIEDSLFYDSKPSWFGSMAWPPIDPVAPTLSDTPAKWRWDRYVATSDFSYLFTDDIGEITGFVNSFDAVLAVSESEVARLYVEYPHVRVVAGTSATYAIWVEAYNNFTANVTLDATGLPTNATDSYGTNPIAYNSSTVATIATTGVTPGTYSITFTGTAVGGEVGSVRVILEVVASDDCAPKVPIRKIRVKQGDNAVFTVIADPTAGYTGDMDLSASGVPSGASGEFADSSIAYNESTTYTIDSGTAAVGEHEIVITGEGPV